MRRYKHSAYIFAGGLPYDLTEGDVLAIFSQYGELVDVNLVKDKDTGAPDPPLLPCHIFRDANIYPRIGQERSS